MTKTITVLGATGIQGGSVVSTFAHDTTEKWNIRAVTRNPSSEKARSLRSTYPDIEVVQGDTNDLDSLKRAFTGSTVIFAVTDYWAPFKDQALREQHATGPNPGDSLRRWAYDEEIKQGKNIANAASAQVGKGLERFIWSALPSTTKYSKGKYPHIYHFDSKAVITDYIRETYPELAAKMSVILIGFFASNMHSSSLMQPIKRPDGSFLIQRLCPPDSKHPFIVTHRDTGLFTKALVDAAPGKTLLAYTAMLSWFEMAQIWARSQNLPSSKLAYKEVSLEDFKKQFPVDGEELLSATYSAEFGFAGRDPSIIEPKDLGFKARPEEIEKWYREQDWSSVLDAEPKGHMK